MAGNCLGFLANVLLTQSHMLFQSLLFSCPSVDNNYNEDCLLELLQSGADFRAAAGIHSWNSMVSNRAALV